MNNSDDNSSNSSNRRSFLTGASLLFAGLSISPTAEATPFMANNNYDLGNTIPLLIPLDGHVSAIHIADGATVNQGDLIADTESIDLNRAMIQVNTAIALVDNNSAFMLGEYMSCVRTLLEITADTNGKFEKTVNQIRDEVKMAVDAEMRNSFELPAREISCIRAAGESRRSKRVLAAFEPELEQLKFRFTTLKGALQNELKIVQDMQKRMRLTAPLPGVIHLMAGIGSFVPKGGYIAYIEIKK